MSLNLNEQEKKERAKFQRIFRIYGITKGEYESFNKGFCPICLKSWSDSIIPCVDHDHTSGRVRGLVCRYCNRYRVGHFRDPALVLRIYQYLQDALELPIHIVPKKKKKRKKKK